MLMVFLGIAFGKKLYMPVGRILIT